MSIVYFVQVGRSAVETDATAKGARVHVVIGDRPVPNQPIKIGFSKHLFRRLTHHSSVAGVRAWLLAAFPGGRREERNVHSMFEHLRTPPPYSRGGTEWFAPADELTNFILSLPRPDISDVEFTQRSVPHQGERLILGKKTSPPTRAVVLTPLHLVTG